MNIEEMDRLNEGQTGCITAEFRDEDQEPVVPGLITYTVNDLATRQELLGKTVFVNPAQEISIELPPEVNIIVNPALPVEIHELTIKAHYGIGGRLTNKIRFVVENLEFYPFPEEE